MGTVRVYQLAKELNVQSALILEMLDRMGRDVRSDLSPLDAVTAELVRTRLTAAIEREKKRLVEERHLEEHHGAERPIVLEPVSETELPVPATEPPFYPEWVTPSETLVTASEVTPSPEVFEFAPDAVQEPAPMPSIETSPAPPPPAHPPSPPAPSATSAPPTLQPAAPGAPRPRVFAAQRTVPLMTSGRTARASSIPSTIGARPGALRPLPGRPPMPARPAVAPPRGPTPAVRPAPVPGTAPVQGRRKKEKDKDKERERALGAPTATRPKPDLPPVPEKIVLSEAVTVKELAEKLNRKSKDVIAKLLTKGVFANINQPLEPTLAVEIALEFGSEASVITFEEEAQQVAPTFAEVDRLEDRPEDLRPRPPVVTVMGHVDHGKTSLLDAIRTTNVVASEHGGITQHIGAYQVEERGRKITFLDTPGHEAFTLMRARGARVTDIVVLVVAADDGVKPQTIEAIDHAKAAGVPIVVAINKVDKPDARPDRVKQQLADRELLVEEYGGQTVACEVSAKKRQGIAELLEMILLVADLKELKANPDRSATGVVLEARLDRARGVISTVLVQNGTLCVGDPFIAGSAYGKVRAMVDELGRRVNEVGPSGPVEVMGFAGEPAAGDPFQVVADEWKARQIASFRQEKVRAAAMLRSSRRTLESLSKEIAEGVAKEMTILLKADVQGSLEAIQKTLNDMPSDKVRLSVLRASTGAITQADVLLASASNAIIVGFNVRPDRTSSELAKKEEVEIRLYTVIYDLFNEIRQAMVGMLEPTLKETVLGQAEVRQLFRVPKIGMVAGCYIIDGRAARSAQVRLIRDNVVVYTGRIGSLRRFKDDVSEVKQGFECGIGIADFNDLKEHDVIEFFVVEQVAAQSL